MEACSLNGFPMSTDRPLTVTWEGKKQALWCGGQVFTEAEALPGSRRDPSPSTSTGPPTAPGRPTAEGPGNRPESRPRSGDRPAAVSKGDKSASNGLLTSDPAPKNPRRGAHGTSQPTQEAPCPPSNIPKWDWAQGQLLPDLSLSSPRWPGPSPSQSRPAVRAPGTPGDRPSPRLAPLLQEHT